MTVDEPRNIKILQEDLPYRISPGPFPGYLFSLCLKIRHTIGKRNKPIVAIGRSGELCDPEFALALRMNGITDDKAEQHATAFSQEAGRATGRDLANRRILIVAADDIPRQGENAKHLRLDVYHTASRGVSYFRN